MLRYLRRRNHQEQDWTWLLSSRVVVLLNEAGAGKTAELLDQATRLNREGYAFFLPIERLCSGPVAEAFNSSQDRVRFEQWRRSKEPAVIFLDSVDEAKLPRDLDKNPLNFAIRRLESVIDEAWSRITIVISSRPSAWSAVLELAEVHRLIARFQARGVKGGLDGAPLERFVSFDPLDYRQQSALAAWAEAPPAFMDDLTKSGSADFARTPLDLLDLVKAYEVEVEAGRTGTAIFESLSEMVDRSIVRRASETGSDRPRNQLSIDRTRSGARRLAAACVLGQQLAIRVSGPGEAGIDPVAVLSFQTDDWSRGAIEQLLACGLFTAAWNGAVRFHHRRTMERLAAEAFDELLRAGTDLETIVRHLTPSAFGQVTVPRPYHEMIGWLATLNAAFRNHIVEVAPQMLLDLGDPGSLPTLTRAAALRGYVGRYKSAAWFDEWYDLALIRRFIDASLEPVCLELLDSPLAEQPMRFLIDMAVLAHWSSCLPRLLAIALDPDLSPDVRVGAIEAVAALGGPVERRALAENALRYRPLPAEADSHIRHSRNRLRIAWVAACRPTEMSIREAVAVLSRLEAKGQSYSVSPDDRLVDSIAAACPPADLHLAHRWLARLCWGPAPRDLGAWDAPQWSQAGRHLMPTLEAVVARCLRERPDLYESRRLIDTTDRLFSVRQVALGPLSRDDDDGPDLLAAAVHDAPAFRRAAFMAAARAGKRRGETPGDMIEWRGAGESAPEQGDRVLADIAWMTDDYEDNPAPEIRAALADALVDRLRHIPTAERRSRVRKLARAARAIGDTPTLQRFTQPGPTLITRARWRFRRLKQRQRWLRHARIRQAWIRTQKRRLALGLHHHAIRRGEKFRLAYTTVFDRHRSEPSLDHVREQYGERAAGALFSGLKIFARRHEADPERRTYGDALAAFGWGLIAIEEPDSLLALGEPQARHALTVALSRPSFPDWAPGVAERHPDIWRQLIVPGLQWELALRDRGEWRHAAALLLAARQSDLLKQTIAPEVLAALAAAPSPQADEIRAAGKIAGASLELREALNRLAENRFRSHMAEGRPDYAAPWFSTWLGSAPRAAWAALRSVRDQYSPTGDEQIEKLLMAFGSHLPIGEAAPDLVAEIALDLARHIRSADDLERGGEVLGRHNAQEMRDSLPALLARDTTVAGRQALLGLADAPAFNEHRVWFDRLLRSQANQAAMPVGWCAPEVTSFFAAYLKRPTNASELCDLVERQLVAIVRDLETSEFDRRGLFATATEADLRAFLGEALLARSRGWYSVTQETVTAGEKRYDLRIEGRVERDEVVIVELKIAGRSWTGDELVDHVQSQLADQYLISRKARFGIYAVVDLYRKARWPMRDGGLRSLDELLADMHRVAADIVSSSEIIDDIRILGLTIAHSETARRVVSPVRSLEGGKGRRRSKDT